MTLIQEIQLGVQAALSDRWQSAHFDVDSVLDASLRTHFVTAMGAFAGQRFEPVHFEAPEDWWQAFKQRWFPRWLQRRTPVRMRVVHWEPTVIYPDIALPDYERWELPYNAKYDNLSGG